MADQLPRDDTSAGRRELLDRLKAMPAGTGRNRPRWRVSAFVEPRDMWVGVFWDRTEQMGKRGQMVPVLKIYVCLLPMLPILFTRRG